MAIISEIQRFKFIIVGIIAICILTFLFEVISPNFNSLRSQNTTVGEVNGSSLGYEEFKKEFDQKEKDFKVQSGKSNLSEEESNQLKNQIWGNFLMKSVVDKNMNNLGLSVSPAEWVEVTTGQNIDPQLKQIPAFNNQLGMFDALQFKNFLKMLNQDEPGTAPGTRKKQWLDFEKQIKDQRKMGKFNAIVENGLYVPKWMSDFDSKLFAASTNINYVVVPYSTIDVNKMTYEKSEVEAYFNENKMKYTPNTPTVKLATIAFSLKPSFNDSVEIMTKFNTKMSEMMSSTNDTTFFRAYGEYNQNFFRPQDLQQHPKAAELFAAAPRSVVGPYISKENVNATRILAKRNVSDSVFVKAITISFQDVMNNQDGINKRIQLVDSIFRMVDTLHMSFEEIAAKYSSDRGQTPPQWININERTWNPEIFTYGGSKPYFKSPSDREGVVRIVKVLNYPATIPAIQIGEISSPYAPSTQTQDATYAAATGFIAKCKTASDIAKIAKTMPNAMFSNEFITGDNVRFQMIEGNSKEAARWAFSSKSGDLSTMMQVGNHYVYCGNLGLRSKDHINFADLEEDILPEFKSNKAFKLIADKMTGTSLQDIANKNKTTVAMRDTFSFRSSNIGQNPEPAIVSVAAALAPNKVSKPIKGTGGVYCITTTKVNPKTSTPADDLNMKMQITQGFKTTQGLLEGMLNRSDVKDNRVNIF